MKHLLYAGACAIALLAAPSAFASTMQCAPRQQISTTYPTGSSYTADAAGIVMNVDAHDLNELAQVGCVQVGVGAGLCGELLNVNMNVGGAGAVGDQPINWFVNPTQSYRLTKIKLTNASRTFAAGSGAGGVYTAAAKGGTAVVAASQTFAGLTALLATSTLDLTLVSGVGDLGVYRNAPLYFSLTTADGTAGTVDLFAYCETGL